MAQSVLLGNKLIKLPGTYAQLISGVTKETPLASYSNVCHSNSEICAGNGFDCERLLKIIYIAISKPFPNH